MKFVFPTFLFALLAVAIPIIIHLFSFRRYKTVYFSNVSFLKDIKKESKKKSRIKQLLLLIARILTIIFLVFAFSQPYIPTGKDTKNQASQIVAIYVDNSFSMNALSSQGQLLEVARNKAVEICHAYPAGTKFNLFTNDLEPKHQHLLNKEQFIQEVASIQSSPVVIPHSLIYSRFAMQKPETENADKNLYFISDFQRSVSDFENFSEENIFSYYLPLTPNQVANLYIDSCWVEVPAHRLNQEENVFVRIKNSSDQNYQNLPLKLYLNDSIKSITNFTVEAQNEIVANLRYTNHTSGTQLGKVEISDYPFTHDNDWYISYFVESNLKALAVYSDTPASIEGLNYISALFDNDDYILLDKVNISKLQTSSLNEYNTVFLMNLENFSSGFLSELEKVISNGTSVVLFPGDRNNPDFNNSFLSKFGAAKTIGIDTVNQKISGIDFENQFFKDVFKKREQNAIFPEVVSHLKFTQDIRSVENKLLWFQNNDKALSSINYNLGKVWVFSFSLEKKNESFAQDVIFVPTIYNIVLNSTPEQEFSFIVGKNTFYNLSREKKVNLNSTIEIENKLSGEKFIPSKNIYANGTRIEFGDQISEAGHYLVQNKDGLLATMAFNYNRKESALTYTSGESIEEKIETHGIKNATVVQDVESNFSEIFDEIQNGKQLWKLFILLSLFFIMLEVVIARFWK